MSQLISSELYNGRGFHIKYQNFVGFLQTFTVPITNKVVSKKMWIKLRVGVNIIRINHECEGRMEKSFPGITVWHYEACRVYQTLIPRAGFFYERCFKWMIYSRA